jgi:hypothetical protein
VLSGKYAGNKDPRAALTQMTHGLEHRKAKLDQAEQRKNMLEAQRRGDRDLARQIATSVTSSNRKQAD